MEYFKNSNEISNKSIKLSLLGNIYSDNNKDFLLKISDNYEYNLEKIIDILSKTEGLFTLIIYDNTSKRKIIINDKLGLKAFYIYKKDEVIVYGDNFLELAKSIENKEINYEAVFEMLSLGYLTGGKTIVKYINNIGAGTINIIENGEINTSIYYKLEEKKGVTIDEIYDSFVAGLSKRTNKCDEIKSMLTGGYDSRFILGNLLKLYPKDMINCYTNNIEKEDLEIAKYICNNLNIKHHIEQNSETENNILKIIEEKLSGKSDNKYGFLSGICGGEILGNALGESWFEADNIEGYVNKNYKYNENEEKIIKGKNNYEYGIKSFVENILRSNINAVEGVAWVNPSSYFDGSIISPFTDSDFVENINSIEVGEIKNYGIYKQLYKKYLPELLDIKYTFNNEREKKEIDLENNFVSKNYILKKNDYKMLMYIGIKLMDNSYIFNNIINKNIVNIKPLEVVIILIQLKILKLEK